ncbi:MAG TPA: glycoside hydrolase family 38 C-terminal domain-containing protein [Candidatus Gastranaerophilaceae bacterium]|nr:glycoside hydrolase family 38 C-terminal domain-containing protein [Candidatus Gastranaerophilaceae bacterium]HPT41572.1 glycoside hydrolase family 38 C-terminal domain-containing protein [Candidatus Gastranaerophilaceae bacterium]
MKKKVIAYLHTHWDREWYREFEVFRLRLLRVFDNVLALLEKGKIPSFYFDGQTAALEDYLELNPEKEKLVRKLIEQKKLFIGPFYTLVDEFLTDQRCFKKNLEIGLKYAKNLGCKDFLGYFADTFGHSQNIPTILEEFGIDKAVVWRGCPDEIPSEFIFNGVKTVNLVRGYFNDIFSTNLSIKEKGDFIQSHLDKIAQKSSDVLLMPIGADHLGLESDILEQIKEVNKLLKDYEIVLSSPFEYFRLVKDNFKFKYEGELRNNSQTFILQGCYSARMKLKQYNVKCSYMLNLANKFQKFAQGKYKTKSYDNIIEYAYKLLLQNQAHDGICGCSTDKVHAENIIRYEKILQIAETIIEELKFKTGEPSLIVNLSTVNFEGVVQFESCVKLPENDCQIIGIRKGFSSDFLQNIHKIPVTEDYTNIYTYLTEVECKEPSKLLSKPHKLYPKIFYPLDLAVSDTKLENDNISLTIKNGKIIVEDKKTDKIYKDFIKFVDFKDKGDSYNFGPVINDKGLESIIISSKILRKGKLQCALLVKFKIGTTILNTEISLNKGSKLLNFKILWNNKIKNHLLQLSFNLLEPIKETYSEDMNFLIRREFDPDYDIRKNLPKTKGIEAKTNTAPMQRYVWAQGFEVVTKGLCEYEVKKNFLLITLLRAIGMISNPKNPARTTPAGPPLEVFDSQQLGENIAEFAIGFGDKENWHDLVEEIYPKIIINKI